MEATVAAIATPIGEGGIGIIRISGEKSLEIINKIFMPVKKEPLKNRYLTYGHIIDPNDKNIIDEVLVSYMEGPRTYTGEDVVEINCHGGNIPLKNTLELVLSEGARLAENGEFTKRAFLNGRLDLSQAEAVIDVIKAKTGKSFDVAMDQLQGGFSKKIQDIRNKIVDVLVNLTVNIDYPDEDIEIIAHDELTKNLKDILSDINKILEGSKRGKIIRDGINVAIIGKPNVGKSSLMNNLLRESRSIVTDIPGTTRDTIEEFIDIHGIPVKIIDTAGIRETEDVIEKIGIELAKSSFNTADYVFFLIDSSRKLDDEDYEILDKIDRENTLFIINKVDKDSKITKDELSNFIGEGNYIETSMNNFDDVLKIEEKFYSIINERNNFSSGMIMNNVRHENSLKDAKANIEDGIRSLNNYAPFEFIEIDVSEAYANLGFITGDSVSSDIINEVFSRFCLGK